jgi:hypothetical protein
MLWRRSLKSATAANPILAKLIVYFQWSVHSLRAAQACKISRAGQQLMGMAPDDGTGYIYVMSARE